MLPENKIIRAIILLLAIIGLGVLVEALWGEKIHG